MPYAGLRNRSVLRESLEPYDNRLGHVGQMSSAVSLCCEMSVWDCEGSSKVLFNHNQGPHSTRFLVNRTRKDLGTNLRKNKIPSSG